MFQKKQEEDITLKSLKYLKLNKFLCFLISKSPNTEVALQSSTKNKWC